MSARFPTRPGANSSLAATPETVTSALWNNRRVLITGHTGFKGSWLSLWLRSHGALVTGYALPPPTSPSMFEACNLRDHVASLEADIRDYSRLEEVMRAAKPEVIFHLAAQPLVRESYRTPRETFEVNTMGTVNVLEATRRVGGVRSIVLVTTDKCYENKEWVWGYRENDRLGGRDPYASSKACTEIAADAYRRSFFPAEKLDDHGVGIATARAGNVIGGGDWASERLVPDLVRCFAKGQKAILRHPEAVRPWQHVIEPLFGYISLAEHLYRGSAWACDAWNFGPGNSGVETVGSLAGHIAKCWGKGVSLELQAPDPALHESTLLSLDSSKAQSLLGWQPRFGVRDAAEMTVNWYKTFYAGSPAQELRDLALAQIRSYGERTAHTVSEERAERT
jgi:CDP-glucose 4,6-dehydratase